MLYGTPSLVAFTNPSLPLEDNDVACLFPAEHFHTKTTSNFPLPLGDLLARADEGTKCPFPGIFVYTRDMPVMVLANVSIIMGTANGTMGTAAGSVLDPSGISYIPLIIL
jgi:hypothetical protein